MFEVHNSLEDEFSQLADDQSMPRPPDNRVLKLNNVTLLDLADRIRSEYTSLVGTETLGKPNKPLKA